MLIRKGLRTLCYTGRSGMKMIKIARGGSLRWFIEIRFLDG
jgi:hypothetical protein